MTYIVRSIEPAMDDNEPPEFIDLRVLGALLREVKEGLAALAEQFERHGNLLGEILERLPPPLSPR
jgi:hypothetical protein